MRGRSGLGLASIALVLTVGGPAYAQTPQTDPKGEKKAPAATEAASAAAKASPDLVNSLAKEMGSTPEQAAGAAGALLGVAKSRLAANDFSTVSSAVPGMDLLLKAAPAASGATGTSGMMGKMAGLASAASAFSKLGLDPGLVSKAVPVLTSFVTKSGGANVGKLLAGVLK